MNFGLESYVPYVLYLLAITSLLLSIFWRPITGLFFLLPLLPLQTIRYRINDLPLGGSLIGVMLVGIAIGLARQGKPVLPKSNWTPLIGVYGIFTYVSLWLGSIYLNDEFPLPGSRRFGTWQEYMVMPALLLIVAALKPTKREMQAIVALICLSILVADKSFWNTVSGSDFSSYSDGLRQEGGTLGYAGINGLAAFAAQSSAFLLALAGFERRTWARLALYALGIFSAVCLMYSLSRGGYAAFVVGCFLVALLKQRKLLVLIVILACTWTAWAPPAVRQRIEMTYDPQSRSLDNSANTRLELWDNAMEVFHSNAILGAGFNTYEYMNLNKRTDGGVGYYQDTHNYFVKILVETGVVGLILFLLLVGKLFFEGFQVFRRSDDPFFASLGLGLVAWLTCVIVANFFGDRWSFLQVNAYMWVIAGMVAHMKTIEEPVAVPEQAEGDEAPSIHEPEDTEMTLEDFSQPEWLPRNGV